MFSLVIIATIFILSAAVQRVSGIGFSLVALPLLVLVVGPLDSVTLIVINSGITSAAMTIGAIREVAWKRLIWLSVPSAIISFPAILLLNVMPVPVVSLLIATLLTICTITLVTEVKVRRQIGRLGEISVGLVSGFMNSAAGVAGPAISAYAFSAGWSYRTFVATAQPYFIISDAAVLLAKFAFRETGETSLLMPNQIGFAVLGCVAGLIIGNKISRWISETTGRWVVVVVAGLGAVTTAGRAIVSLV